MGQRGHAALHRERVNVRATRQRSPARFAEGKGPSPWVLLHAATARVAVVQKAARSRARRPEEEGGAGTWGHGAPRRPLPFFSSAADGAQKHCC